jgi:hypothetical protein
MYNIILKVETNTPKVSKNCQSPVVPSTPLRLRVGFTCLSATAFYRCDCCAFFDFLHCCYFSVVSLFSFFSVAFFWDFVSLFLYYLNVLRRLLHLEIVPRKRIPLRFLQCLPLNSLLSVVIVVP